MPAPRRVRRAACVLAVLGSLAIVGPTAASPAARQGGGSAIELVAQTPAVAPGEAFAVRFRLSGVPADGSVRVIVHQRVRSRSELALSMEGEGLRTEARDSATALASLPAAADGTRRLVVSLDPTAGGLPLRTEGVYPVELVAQDASADPLARVITHLIVAPEEGDDAPALGVAPVADISAPPALQPDGGIRLRPDDLEDLGQLVAGLAAAPDVTVTVAARPETIDALAASPEPGPAEIVAALRGAVEDRAVLALPYVEVRPDELAPNGLIGELGVQTEAGRAVLADALGASPEGTVWLDASRLGAEGLRALAFIGVRRIVVADDQVAPLDPGIIRYSLAQPFELTPPEDDAGPDVPAVQALATDPAVLERLTTPGSAGLVASRVLAELALLRLEQPSVARSVVLPLEPGMSSEAVRLILDGLDAGRPFTAMTLDDAFSHAAPLLDGGGNPVDLPLLPVTVRAIDDDDARALDDARTHLDTFRGLVGEDSPRAEPLAHHLLVAAAAGLPDARRAAHIDAVETAIDAVTSEVSTPARFTLTLAAREGTIPLTIHNDSGLPLTVSVHLRSQKLEFPEGDTIEIPLTGTSTRIDIPVRARASGAFPLRVDVRTPDGDLTLSTTRYTVRSTAVSGAGLILSGGALLFLIVWWARHWRRTARSARLVAADAHPSAT